MPRMLELHRQQGLDHFWAQEKFLVPFIRLPGIDHAFSLIASKIKGDLAQELTMT